MKITNLILEAQEGKQMAFTQLLDIYWNEVYGFMLKKTENESDAEDITIDAFSKAFSKIDQYNPEYQFNTWLISIAKNAHIDLVRKRKHTRPMQFNDDGQAAYLIIDESPTAEDNLINEQNLSILLRFIKELKPAYQEVIQLRYFQEMSYQEISNQLDEPLSNVKIKLLRAKKLLADIILKRK